MLCDLVSGDEVELLGGSEGLGVVETLKEPVRVKAEEVPGRVTVEKEAVLGEGFGEASEPEWDE